MGFGVLAADFLGGTIVVSSAWAGLAARTAKLSAVRRVVILRIVYSRLGWS